MLARCLVRAPRPWAGLSNLAEWSVKLCECTLEAPWRLPIYRYECAYSALILRLFCAYSALILRLFDTSVWPILGPSTRCRPDAREAPSLEHGVARRGRTGAVSFLNISLWALVAYALTLPGVRPAHLCFHLYGPTFPIETLLFAASQATTNAWRPVCT